MRSGFKFSKSSVRVMPLTVHGIQLQRPKGLPRVDELQLTCLLHGPHFPSQYASVAVFALHSFADQIVNVPLSSVAYGGLFHSVVLPSGT